MSSSRDLPEAPPIEPALRDRLAAALAAKRAAPGGYLPRTHHLDGNAPKYTNRLILESSPYLLQHAHNPVDWRPWGDEVFEEAHRLERPVEDSRNPRAPRIRTPRAEARNRFLVAEAPLQTQA